MADGKKRRREGGDITNTAGPSGLEQYVEVVFYECAFSAQYTANIQILFNIEDIQRRMPVGSFLEGFGEAKRKGLAWVNDTIETWLKKQTGEVQNFFQARFPARNASYPAAGTNFSARGRQYTHACSGNASCRANGNGDTVVAIPDDSDGTDSATKIERTVCVWKRMRR